MDDWKDEYLPRLEKSLIYKTLKSKCETFLGQLLAYGVPQLCKINAVGLSLCDVHCTCIHNAKYGKCIDPTGIPNIYVPDRAPSRMCTCDYMNARPDDMPSIITRGNSNNFDFLFLS